MNMKKRPKIGAFFHNAARRTCLSGGLHCLEGYYSSLWLSKAFPVAPETLTHRDYQKTWRCLSRVKPGR